jgi:hypothetical protein
VAPWSAKYFAVMGPTPIHEKSAIFTPSKGNDEAVRDGARRAVGRGSASSSRLCSPIAGAVGETPPAFATAHSRPGARSPAAGRS